MHTNDTILIMCSKAVMCSSNVSHFNFKKIIFMNKSSVGRHFIVN